MLFDSASTHFTGHYIYRKEYTQGLEQSQAEVSHPATGLLYGTARHLTGRRNKEETFAAHEKLWLGSD